MPENFDDCSTFTVDGTNYHLYYNFNDLVDAEDVTNCNLLTAMESIGSGTLTARQLRGLVYAMIVKYRGFPEKPEEQLLALGKLLRMDTIPIVLTAIGEACAIAVGKEFAEEFRRATQAPAPEAEEAAPIVLATAQ